MLGGDKRRGDKKHTVPVQKWPLIGLSEEWFIHPSAIAVTAGHQASQQTPQNAAPGRCGTPTCAPCHNHRLCSTLSQPQTVECCQISCWQHAFRRLASTKTRVNKKVTVNDSHVSVHTAV